MTGDAVALPGDHGMSADGTYGFVYCGDDGVGIGYITIQNNILKGVDLFGTQYTGTVGAIPNSAGYKIVCSMSVPANVLLVQGTAPQDISHRRDDITFDIPPDFDNGEPIPLIVPPGKVTLMIRKIRDDLAWLASAKVTITPA
jgi:hypothetical protein